MTGRLAAWVHVPDETGETHAFGPDDVVPEWAAAKITNPKAWAADEGEEVPVVEVAPPSSTTGAPASTTPAADPPPKAGLGSGLDAWLAHAEAIGVEIADGAGRADVIVAVEAAGTR